MTASAQLFEDGLPTPRRWQAAIAVWLAIAMTVLDSAIANVALPTIAHDFGAAPSESIWIVNAYQLAIVIALLPLASLGDIIGYRPHLSRGPGPVHRRLAGLRAVALDRHADRSPAPCRVWARPG